MIVLFMVCILMSFSSHFLHEEKVVDENYDKNNLSV